MYELIVVGLIVGNTALLALIVTSETVSDDWVEMLRMIEDSSPLRAARQRVSR